MTIVVHTWSIRAVCPVVLLNVHVTSDGRGRASKVQGTATLEPIEDHLWVHCCLPHLGESREGQQSISISNCIQVRIDRLYRSFFSNSHRNLDSSELNRTVHYCRHQKSTNQRIIKCLKLS